MFIETNEWNYYPIHDFDSIILPGLVIVFQCIKLALHRVFCTKLNQEIKVETIDKIDFLLISNPELRTKKQHIQQDK